MTEVTFNPDGTVNVEFGVIGPEPQVVPSGFYDSSLPDSFSPSPRVASPSMQSAAPASGGVPFGGAITSVMGEAITSHPEL